jgi:hypothetical protein
MGRRLTCFFSAKFAIAGGAFGHSARYIDTEGNLVAVWQPPAKPPM